RESPRKGAFCTFALGPPLRGERSEREDARAGEDERGRLHSCTQRTRGRARQSHRSCNLADHMQSKDVCGRHGSWPPYQTEAAHTAKLRKPPSRSMTGWCQKERFQRESSRIVMSYQNSDAGGDRRRRYCEIYPDNCCARLARE